MKNENTNADTMLQVSDLLLWHDEQAHALLTQIATNHGIAEAALAELLAWVRDSQHKQRRRDRNSVLDAVFDNNDFWKE